VTRPFLVMPTLQPGESDRVHGENSWSIWPVGDAEIGRLTQPLGATSAAIATRATTETRARILASCSHITAPGLLPLLL